MNERAVTDDNINGLVEHQMAVRFSPKLAERVHREFLGVDPAKRPPLTIEWNDREAVVTFGSKQYPGTLFDLPTVTETYKMISKSRLFKSGDMGQMLVVYDPDDEDETAFFLQQRHDPHSHTLLSGLTPPSTFVWSRIFKKQNRMPQLDFKQVEKDLGEVNVAGKEDVQTEFIHPRELDKLFLKPGQRLRVDGVDVQPIEGLSVGGIIKQKRQEKEESLVRQLAEEKRRRKEEKRRRKEAAAGILPGESSAKRSRPDAPEGAAEDQQPILPSWQRAVMSKEVAARLESEIGALQSELDAAAADEARQAELRKAIQDKKRELAASLVQ